MSWKPELEELARRTELAKEMGGAERVALARAPGRRGTVRERIDALLDPGSCHETGTLAGRATYIPDFDVSVELLGSVPVVAAALGPVAGLGAARVAASHFSVMVRGTSQLFVAGPPVVRRALGREVTKEDGLRDRHRGVHRPARDPAAARRVGSPRLRAAAEPAGTERSEHQAVGFAASRGVGRSVCRADDLRSPSDLHMFAAHVTKPW